MPTATDTLPEEKSSARSVMGVECISLRIRSASAGLVGEIGLFLGRTALGVAGREWCLVTLRRLCI